MRTLSLLCVVFALVGGRTAEAQNLLLNGNLDSPGPGMTINDWTKEEFKTNSGVTADLVTLEPWIEVGPVTSGGGDADLGAFLKAFQGSAATGDLATLHLYQDVVALPGLQYTLSGWIGAGRNYSGLADGPTKTELAIEFDDDNIRGNGFLSSAVLDVRAAGLASGPGPAFGAQEFTVTGTAPLGALFARARVSMIDAHNTQNPDPSAFIDDFSLTAVVPEPGSLMAVIGVGCVALLRRRSTNK